MGMEIERRFLVNGEAWRQQGEALAYVQGYLSVDPERTVRVRIVDQQAWLTLKARVSDASRHEFEYEIPKTEAQTILDVMCSQAISKNRTRVAFAGNIWEVDEFFGMARQGSDGRWPLHQCLSGRSSLPYLAGTGLNSQ
jgi:CYTH domain-containing protein